MKVPENPRKELDPECKKIIFVGYTSMGYRLLDPVTNNTIISRNIIFNEEKNKLCATDMIRESVPAKI